MPGSRFNFVYGKNSGRVFSVDELKEIYFHGIPFATKDGVEMTNESIQFYIDAAQEELENYLTLKFEKQIISEQKDFYKDDFEDWSYIRTTYPVVEAFELKGFISDIQQIEYPKEWLSFRRTNDGKLYHRHIYLVPGAEAAKTNSIVYSGISPHLGYYGINQIPNYWRPKYCTGFDSIPKDILNAIGQLASIKIFNILGDIVLGAGIASSSIGIDSLSQSITTTQSAENAAYSARIRMYLQDLKLNLPKMKAYYNGLTFAAF